MIDQYAEDCCGQHRTEHYVDRFKCVQTFTGSKFSVLRYGIRS